MGCLMMMKDEGVCEGYDFKTFVLILFIVFSVCLFLMIYLYRFGQAKGALDVCEDLGGVLVPTEVDKIFVSEKFVRCILPEDLNDYLYMNGLAGD